MPRPIVRPIPLLLALACSLALVGPAFAHDPSAAGEPVLIVPDREADGPPASLSGTLRLFHVDDFADGIGRDAYALETGTETIALDISGTPPESLNGARVRVRGRGSTGGSGSRWLVTRPGWSD